MDRRGTIARLLEIGMPEGFRILHDIKKEIAKLKHQVEIAEQKNEALQMCYTNGSESQLQQEAQDPLVAAVKASAAAANLYEGLHSSVEVGKDQEELAYAKVCKQKPRIRQHARLNLDAKAMDLRNEIEKMKLKIQLVELKDRIERLLRARPRSSQSQAPMIIGAHRSHYQYKRCMEHCEDV